MNAKKLKTVLKLHQDVISKVKNVEQKNYKQDELIFDHEITFPDGKRMAIQAHHNGWSQGVLFAPSGVELGYTDVGEELLGEYIVWSNDTEYNVLVQEAKWAINQAEGEKQRGFRLTKGKTMDVKKLKIAAMSLLGTLAELPAGTGAPRSHVMLGCGLTLDEFETMERIGIGAQWWSRKGQQLFPLEKGLALGRDINKQYEGK